MNADKNEPDGSLPERTKCTKPRRPRQSAAGKRVSPRTQAHLAADERRCTRITEVLRSGVAGISLLCRVPDSVRVDANSRARYRFARRGASSGERGGGET